MMENKFPRSGSSILFQHVKGMKYPRDSFGCKMQDEFSRTVSGFEWYVGILMSK